MSIQKRQRKKGTVYVVHYYDTDERKYVNKSFDRSKDATAFEAQVVLAKRRGDLDALDAGKETLSEFIETWWKGYGLEHLAPATQKGYRYPIERLIEPELGTVPLRHLSPLRINAWMSGLRNKDVGRETVRRAAAILQGILQRAVEWQRIQVNPVKAVKKPGKARSTTAKALDPTAVEALRRSMGGGRDRTIVSVLAYAGLRPGECLALTWEDVGDRVLNVDKSISLGAAKATKTGRSRQVELLDPLKKDLRAWKLKSGTREGLVFPSSSGGPWTDTMYRNWRRRVWREAAPKGVRPYDLRHSFASLMFAAGKNPAWIAEQMGHTLQVLLSTYVRLIEELKDADTIDPEQLIRDARSAHSRNARSLQADRERVRETGVRT